MVSTQSMSLITRLQSPLSWWYQCFPLHPCGAEHHHWGPKAEQSKGFHAEFHQNTPSMWQHILTFYISSYGKDSSDLIFLGEAYFSTDAQCFSEIGAFRRALGSCWMELAAGSKRRCPPPLPPSTLGLTTHTWSCLCVGESMFRARK